MSDTKKIRQWTRRERVFKCVFMFALLLCLLSACGYTTNTASVAQTTATSQAAVTTSHTALTTTQSSGSHTVQSQKTASNNKETFITIRMLNQSSGWGLTTNGVYRTYDGGQSWRSVTPARSAINSTVRGTFADAQHAWIAYSVLQSNSVTVISTRDGGNNWEFAHIQALEPVGVDMPHFWGAGYLSGWLLVYDGGGPGAGNLPADLYYTSNSGLSWSHMSSLYHGYKSGVSFLDAVNGFEAGYDYASGAFLYATHDVGKTWQRLSLPVLPTSSADIVQYSTQPPVIFSPVIVLTVNINGVINGKNVNDVLFYRSDDNGRTWYSSYARYGSKAISPCQAEGSNVYIADVNHAYMSDTHSGTFCQTSNGGASWQKTSGNVGPYAQLFDFVNAQNGWAVGDQGRLLRTFDGGNSWRAISYSLR